MNNNSLLDDLVIAVRENGNIVKPRRDILFLLEEGDRFCDENTRLRVLLATAKKALELVKMHANPDMDNHVQYYDIACRAIKEIGGDA